MPGAHYSYGFVCIQCVHLTSLGRLLFAHLLIDRTEATDESAGEIKHICVVGAGPVGLGAIKIVKDAPEFKEGKWTVTAFEARDNLGGIW